MNYLDRLEALATEREDLDFTRGPATDKPAAWIDVSSGERLGQLIVWLSGEADLRAGQRGDGEPELNEHRTLAGLDDVDRALADVLTAVQQ